MKTIRGRLVLHYLALVFAGVVLVWAGTLWATRNTFESYVAYQQAGRAEALVPALEQYWSREGSWTGVSSVLGTGTATGGRGPGRGGMWMGGQGMGSAGVPAYRIVLLDAANNVAYDGYPEGGRLPEAVLAEAAPVVVDGVEVGALLVTGTVSGVLGSLEEAFLDRVRTVLTVIALVSLALGVLLSLRFAGEISRPIEKLSDVAAGLARGRGGQKVDLGPRDAPQEISGLVQSFNSMSRELAESDARRVDLLRDVSHEIRTPLTILSGNLEAVSTGAIEMNADTLATMSGEIDRLKGLVADLDRLDRPAPPARAAAGRASPGSLTERAVASIQGAAAAKGIVVEHATAPGLPDVSADPDQVQQVFANILSNALRYTPDNGTISVRAAKQEQPKGDGGRVVFSVTDNGPGIPREHLSRIFDRLFRGDTSRARSTGGSGLGLAIAKSLVEGWDGVIWAENVAGGGAAFFFTVPVAAEAVRLPVL